MTSLVIFDLDGTLLNTNADLGTATNHAMEVMGYPVHQISAYNQMVGNGVRRLIERALPDDATVRTPENVDRALAHFKEYYNEHLCDKTRPYDGIPQLLEELNSRGIRMAVASNKYQEATGRLIAHFFPNIPWAAVHGQRSGIPVKPDPSIVFQILLESPTPKDQVLYCGDSGVDMQTAARAGVRSCGVTWGFRSRAELKANYAEIIVDTPDDILTYL